MKISIAQMDVRLAEPAYNFARAEEMIRQAAAGGADVVLIPETFNTGFFPKENLASYCDRDGAEVKRRMGALAAELKINIVAGSVANVKPDGGIYNSAYVFDRQGECIAQYDKTHLFSPSGEHEYFKAGDKLCTFQLDGHPCGLIICYDIRFLELVRTLALTGLDVLFVPAEWPGLRRYHWQTLTAARAIENQMFVAACNSCSKDTGCGGTSRILDPWGEVLAEADDQEQIISADLDFSVIEGIRRSINVYRDRRPELYDVRKRAAQITE